MISQSAHIVDLKFTWVNCDLCDFWVHKLCVSDKEQSFSGDFMCNFCNGELSMLEVKQHTRS